MKHLLLFFYLAFSICALNAQQINGQWRGFFNSKGDIVLSGSDNTEYVLELDIKGKQVTGFSYSYFQGRKYYVICKLDGIYYPNSKSVKIVETERIKGNTPPDFQDCFQVHYLTYQKEGKQEQLTGRWITAPGQRSSCGDGATTLSRRTLDKSLVQLNKARSQSTTPAKASTKNKGPEKATVTTRTQPNTKTEVTTEPQKTTSITPQIAIKDPTPNAPKEEFPKKESPIGIETNFAKRKAEIIETIEIQQETFRVDLYDNGEVDGDSVTLFYNNKLIVSHKRLSEKPLTLKLDAPPLDEVNELTMYAENLGEIPPNTALMVVTDGDKRYEVRISSDLKNSGTIRFKHKK